MSVFSDKRYQIIEIKTLQNLCHSEVKVKVSPLQAMKAHRDVDARVHIFTAMALG